MAGSSSAMILWVACSLSWWSAAHAIVWTLEKSMVGPDFFAPENWGFFSDADPTEGAVNYVDRETAMSHGMVKATADRVYLGPDLASVKPGDSIPSVRLEGVTEYNSGLFVIQMDHQPTGCGVWPAFWMTGGDEQHPWPVWGEADFIEGAHGQNEVWTTLHTSQNCDQSSLKAGVDFTGHWMPGSSTNPAATNCSIHAEDQGKNEGCPEVGPFGTMGKAFNDQGGGTFAFEWDPEAGHVRAFFWAPGQEPADLKKGGTPTPDAWGKPYAMFVLGEATCPTSRFYNMRLVLNTDFCGLWGNPEGSFHEACPEIPSSLTCPMYVSTFTDKLAEAYWSITRLDVYQPSKEVREEVREEVVVV